jgi:hypothetical protein
MGKKKILVAKPEFEIGSEQQPDEVVGMMDDGRW